MAVTNPYYAMEYFLSHNLKTVGDYFKGHKNIDADVIAYYGMIGMEYISFFKHRVEKLYYSNEPPKKGAIILLYTNGGSIETVEKFVEMIRNFYEHVIFIIPYHAMSAGTIWCMSADEIYMNYASSLGPIDVQVFSSDGKWIPAQGYLDKMKDVIEKSKKNEASPVEIDWAINFDKAEIQLYEQAKELTVDLLKKWLVKYKFKNWLKHETDKEKLGKQVTEAEKEERAKEIAKKLSDTSLWRTHSRMLGIKTLQNNLRLSVQDYSDDKELNKAIEDAHASIISYMNKEKFGTVVITSDDKE